MQNKIIFSLIVILQALFFATGFSATQNRLELNLKDAVQYALDYNKNIINAGLSVNEAELQLRETIAAGLPKIDAKIDYNNFFGSTASLGSMPGFDIEFNPTSNLSVSLGQLIFSGSYIVGIQMAKAFKEITETTFEKSELEIKSQVTRSYYLTLIAIESGKIVEANHANMMKLLANTRALVDAGIADELDYDQLLVQSNLLANAIRATERQIELAQNMVRLNIGLPSSTDIVLTDDLESIINEADFYSTLINPFTLFESIDYQLLTLQTTLADKQIDMERAAYLPTVAGFYNYTEKLMKAEFDLTPNHVIGFNVSIPIFSSGLRNSRVKQARINYEIAMNQKELVSEQLSIQEKQLRFNLENAIDQFESQKSNLEVAKRVFNNYQTRFSQGVISSLELTTANTNYLQAENSFIMSVMELLDAKLELDKLLNTI